MSLGITVGFENHTGMSFDDHRNAKTIPLAHISKRVHKIDFREIKNDFETFNYKTNLSY